MLIFPIILGAVVFAGQNPKDIPLKPIDEPKVMVLINEKIGETRTTNCETAIVDKLLEYKFNLVDPATVAALLGKGDNLIIRACSGDKSAAIKIATSNGAQVIIVGNVKTSLGPSVYSMQSGQADISIQAIICSNGKIIASENLHGAALHISAEAAQVEAIKKASKKIIKNSKEGKIVTSFLDKIICYAQKEGWYPRTTKNEEEKISTETSYVRKHDEKEVVVKGKPGLSQLPQYDNNFALVVGVSHYKNIPRLPYPEKDIELMQEVVTKIMGVKRKNLFLLKNPTKTEVISQIKKVTRLAGSYNNPKIIFYFSGHGTAYAKKGARGEGYLLPIEADPEDISTTSVSLREIENLLARAKGEKVVIIDACFSGKGKSILLAGKPFIGIKKVAPTIGRTTILLSSQETEISTYIKEKGVSTFTYALYEMLGKYGPVLDENKNGWLEAKEVAEKLRNFTDNYAIRFANQHQHPVIRGNLDISLAQRP